MDVGREKRAHAGVPDVVIAGGGIIGLALGLELRLRGMSVTVLERGQAMRGASWAAGGMLAAEDPQNPPGMMKLARLSARLYPQWLRKIEALSELSAPIRTQHTLQWVGPEVCEQVADDEEIRRLAPGLRSDGLRFRLIEEGSLDPRDLCEALPRAFVAAGGRLTEGRNVAGVVQAEDLKVHTDHGELPAGHFVNCCGAWAADTIEGLTRIPIAPVKGQMVELRCAPERLKCVVRAPGVYLIPRGEGRVAVGATLENGGFDTQVQESAIAQLVRTAQDLLPELAVPQPLRSWAGLRPGTPDGLPVMGPAKQRAGQTARCWQATGHYRDGILLAPGTAYVMAQAILGEQPDVSLQPFSPARFASAVD